MFQLLSSLMVLQVVLASHAEQPTADEPSLDDEELMNEQLIQKGKAHAIISEIPSPLERACSDFVKRDILGYLPLILLQYLAEEGGLSAEEQKRWQELTQLLQSYGWPTVDALVLAIKSLETFRDTSPFRWSDVEVEWDRNISAAELEHLLEQYIKDDRVLAASKKVLNTLVKVTSLETPLVGPADIAAVVRRLCDERNSSNQAAAAPTPGSSDGRSKRPHNYFWFLYD
jgi:hypothetical protein